MQELVHCHMLTSLEGCIMSIVWKSVLLKPGESAVVTYLVDEKTMAMTANCKTEAMRPTGGLEVYPLNCFT